MSEMSAGGLPGLPKPRLVYSGTPIGERNEMLCLTDMWRAADSLANREPWNWARKEGASFIEFIAESLNLPSSQVWTSERGQHGGTWAHWQIGIAYAKYLTHEFHAWCNVVVRAHMEGRALPATVTKVALCDDQIERIADRTAERVTPLIDAVEARQAARHTAFELRMMKEFERRVPRKRPAKKTREIHFEACNRLYEGKCPCCSTVIISDGVKTLSYEIDHWYSRERRGLFETWPTCKNCNIGFDTGRFIRDDYEGDFKVYKRKLKAMLGITETQIALAI
jgi:hypothetical protein